MDILDSYNESKKALREITSKLFLIFETNDLYKIIRNSDINFLELTDHQSDDSKVYINLMSFSDMSPRIIFVADRERMLSCDEDEVVKDWHAASREHIERTNITKARKFLKEFPEHDHDLIKIIVMNYANLSCSKNDNDIATIAAKAITKHLEESLK